MAQNRIRRVVQRRQVAPRERFATQRFVPFAAVTLIVGGMSFQAQLFQIAYVQAKKTAGPARHDRIVAASWN